MLVAALAYKNGDKVLRAPLYESVFTDFDGQGVSGVFPEADG